MAWFRNQPEITWFLPLISPPVLQLFGLETTSSPFPRFDRSKREFARETKLRKINIIIVYEFTKVHDLKTMIRSPVQIWMGATFSSYGVVGYHISLV